MNPLWILLIGMAVVIGGIFILRLHAFISLLAGAVAVALLTPSVNVYRSALRAAAIPVIRSSLPTNTFRLNPREKVMAGTTLLVMRPLNTVNDYSQAAKLTVVSEDASDRAVARLVWPGGQFSMGRDDLIVTAAAEASARAAWRKTIGDRIADGFATMAKQIGILIAMAAILAKSLMESGAAERIVASFRRALGDRNAAAAFLLSGFVLAALILSDTTFYLLIPLAQVMRVRSGRNYLLYVLSIVAGAVMTHSLVPPAPGPVAVAVELQVNLLSMIIGGGVIGAIAASAGFVYALWANRRWEIPLREMPGASHEELAVIAARDESRLPPLWLSLLPIMVPVLLIATGAVASQVTSVGPQRRLLETLGDKNLAMMIAAAIGILIVWSRPAGAVDQRKFPTALAEGLASAGVMVLIICAGGAFGQMVQQTDIAATFRNLLPGAKLALLPMIFLVTTAVRTAQGSAMVSMITAVGIVSPIAAAGDLGYSPLYLALAIGCGSKPILWMNDAGFWIICKMSGMTESETLKTVSVMMAIMAIAGLLATMAAAWLLPLR
jgi:GntP family gluconate:H+ symporter